MFFFVLFFLTAIAQHLFEQNLRLSNSHENQKTCSCRNQFFPGHTDKRGETKFFLSVFLATWAFPSMLEELIAGCVKVLSFSFLPHVIQFRGPVWIYCLSLWPRLSEQSAIWLSGQTLGGAGNKGRASGFMCAAIWDPFFWTCGQLIRDVCQTKDTNCSADFLFIHTLSRLL